MSTGIEWTDETWNPVTGCTKVSAGCKHCYAERISNRFGRDFSRITFHPDRLTQPLRWRRPRRVFVNSMSDLFHEEIPAETIRGIFSVMKDARQHTFQVLTKRPGRMLSICATLPRPPNVWLGVSCEDQATADERIPLLLKTPAAVRFVSCEPLLGQVDLTAEYREDRYGGMHRFPHLDREHLTAWIDHLDWVIVGGESGPGARPMDIEWARNIVTHCRVGGVPVFVKQLGGWPDKRGKPEDWPEDLRVREWPS